MSASERSDQRLYDEGLVRLLPGFAEADWFGRPYQLPLAGLRLFEREISAETYALLWFR